MIAFTKKSVFFIVLSTLTLPSIASAAFVNGSCGTANETYRTSPPAYNAGKCATGTPSAISGSGPWTWTCNGSDGGSTVSCITYVTGSRVNAQCGTAVKTQHESTPTANLCNAGAATTVTGTGPWNWTCHGSNGGTDMSCTAQPVPFVNGSCGSANNTLRSTAPIYPLSLCATGIASTVSGDSEGPWNWSCSGTAGGTSSSCVAYKTGTKQNGACGTSNGMTLTAAPTTNLCKTGTATAVSGTGPWNWTCQGISMGADASCSANIVIGGPYIDTTKIPTDLDPGQAEELIRPAANLTKVISPDGSGIFRNNCQVSHFAFDDPLVFPNQPGRSHLHMFFGNALTNAYSTAATIANLGNSTCRGGILDRSAYWVPAFVDTKDGSTLLPTKMSVYYSTGKRDVPLSEFKQPLPEGLRMIAGTSMNSSPPARGMYSPYYYTCVDPETSSEIEGAVNSYEVPNCPVGKEVRVNLIFPNCWDGKNLDSADHKSHMAFPVNGACPVTHPVALTEVSIHTNFAVTEANQPLRWRLVSDMYDPELPAGYSYHGDFINGWKATTINTWFKNCNQASGICNGGMLGDGTALSYPTPVKK